jgi:hypothetical protein
VITQLSFTHLIKLLYGNPVQYGNRHHHHHLYLHHKLQEFDLQVLSILLLNRLVPTIYVLYILEIYEII